MRSYVLTAALAATLLSTSLTLGYAASPTATFKTEGRSATEQMPARKVHPARPVAYRVMNRNPRLSLIDAELGKAAHRIEADRHHGYLTAMEARKVRAEEWAIRAAAAATAHRNGGRLPEATFLLLQGRVSDLNRNIHRYATNSAHA